MVCVRFRESPSALQSSPCVFSACPLCPPHISGAHPCVCQWACLILWTPRVSPGSLTPRPPGGPPPPAPHIWHSDCRGAFSSLSFSPPRAWLQCFWQPGMDVIPPLLLHYSSKDTRAYTDGTAVRKMGFVLACVPASHMVEDRKHHGWREPGRAAPILDWV